MHVRTACVKSTLAVHSVTGGQRVEGRGCNLAVTAVEGRHGGLGGQWGRQGDRQESLIGRGIPSVDGQPLQLPCPRMAIMMNLLPVSVAQSHPVGPVQLCDADDAARADASSAPLAASFSQGEGRVQVAVRRSQRRYLGYDAVGGAEGRQSARARMEGAWEPPRLVVDPPLPAPSSGLQPDSSCLWSSTFLLLQPPTPTPPPTTFPDRPVAAAH